MCSEPGVGGGRALPRDLATDGVPAQSASREVCRCCQHTTCRLYVGSVSVERTGSDEDKADALFHALADRTRRDIVRCVLRGEQSITALAARYDMSFAAVQKHVAVLERVGLVVKRRIGRQQLASGEVEAVRSVASMLGELESIWLDQATLARGRSPTSRCAGG